jgi:hypothetical protein
VLFGGFSTISTWSLPGNAAARCKTVQFCEKGTRLFMLAPEIVWLMTTTTTCRRLALGLRLYDPDSKQWSLNFSNVKTGTLSTPMIGEFKNGRGEFFSSETLYNRSIFVRFVIINTNENTIRFEQSFSDDGGKTWELNWVAVDTRVTGSPVKAH